MNLTNKQITPTTMEITSFPPKTVVTVIITETIMENVYKQVNSFKLEFDTAYSSLADPALLNAIQEKLLEIPD